MTPPEDQQRAHRPVVAAIDVQLAVGPVHLYYMSMNSPEETPIPRRDSEKTGP